MSIKDKIDRCIKEGEKGGWHKGLRKIKISEEELKGHLQKAIHNFKAMIDFQRIGYSDWSASASFYCLYHCLLALILKEGYESRNQSCTFAYIEEMIRKTKISLNKEELNEIRENMQYSIKTSLEDKEFLELKERTKKLFDKLRNDIEK